MGYLLKRLLKRFLKWYYNYRLNFIQRKMFECSLELHLYTAKTTLLKAYEFSFNEYYKNKLRSLK